jgi:hypothetical protein
MTFHQSMTVMADSEDRAEVIQQGRLVLGRMADELKGSFIPTEENRSKSFRYGLVGHSTKEGDDFMDRLDFTTFTNPQANSPENIAEICELGYFLDHEPGGKGLTLFRRQDGAIDGDLLQGGRSLALCDRVRSLSFLFFDRQGGKQKEWNSLEGVRRHQLPSRIEIRLKMEDSRGQVHVFRTQVYLTMSGERA